MGFLWFLIIVGLLWFGTKQSSEIKRLTTRLRPIQDVEAYVELARKRAEASLQEAEGEAKAILARALSKRRELVEAIMALQTDTELARRDLQIANTALELVAEDAHLLEVGYFEPLYGFEDLPRFEKEIKRIKDKQKAMLALPGEQGDRKAAAYRAELPPALAAQEQGKDMGKLIKNILLLMLRAFNGECDSLIARVNYRNIEAMKKRMQSSYDQINKLAEGWGCLLSAKYLASRQAELQLVFEYEEKKQKEKEEQAQIREQMREEQKAIKEAERERQQAEKQEAEYQELLEKARLEAAKAGGEDKEQLNAKIQELQRQISEIEEKKRAISQAMITRAGYVYILSNVGSFGEDVYKIGMTRRLDPMERDHELGDASVPFPFDVHALISANDAPALESSLHKHFHTRRVNLENERKEFFRVSIDEIRLELEQLKQQLGIETELSLTLIAEAKQYRISEAKRKHFEAES